MLRKKVFLYVSFVKSVQFVCAIIQGAYNLYYPITAKYAILLKKEERRRKGIIKVTIDSNKAHEYNNMIKNSSDILIASDAKILVKYTNQGNW